MKHLKIYESFNLTDVKEGDYVILNPSVDFTPGASLGIISRYFDFVGNNIGQIILIDKDHNNVKIKYHNIDFNIRHLFDKDGAIFSHQSYIKYAGSTIEDIMIQYEADKFNL